MDIEKSKTYIAEHYDKAGLLVYSKNKATYLRRINDCVTYLMHHYDAWSELDKKAIAQMKEAYSLMMYASSKIDEGGIHEASWWKTLDSQLKEFRDLEKMSNRYEKEIDILGAVMKSYLCEAEPLTLTVKFPNSMRNRKIKVMI